MFECSGGGKGVQGVIKHHNSVSLPRVKERQAEKKSRGEMKGSPTSMSGTEEGGGDRWEENRLTKLHLKFYIQLISVISATCQLLCATGLLGLL